MKKNLKTSAGYSTKHYSQENIDFSETILQVFAIFELNYHSQYHAAIGTRTREQNLIRLWKNSLDAYSTEIILKAANHLIKNNQYLPNISQMIDACNNILVGDNCPDELAAYEEACSAPHPKNDYHWSHAAVYFAGARVGWERIETQPESTTFPLFKQCFKQVKAEIAQGVEMNVSPTPLSIEKQHNPVPKEEMGKYLEQLKTILKTQ